ncbi:MAG: YncE family protein [Caulobacteraceae bacterium]
MKHSAIPGLLTALLSLSAPAAWAQGPAMYTMSKVVPLGGPDRWDYVVFDPSSHRVFVAHGDRLSVVDGRNGARLGEVTGIPGGTHGVAISAPTGRGYTDDGQAGKVVAFDLKTLKLEKAIVGEPDADGMTLDPLTGHVFVVNGDSATVTVVDPRANAVAATIKVGGKLEYAAADGAGKLYVNGAGAREIVRIDTRTNQVDARWPVPDCDSPHGLAIDPKHRRLFSSCVNGRLMVVDIDHGAVVASLPIGRGTDAAAYDPVRQRVFSSNGVDGTLTVIQQKDANTYAVAATVKTAVTGRTIGIDPASGRIYLVAADADPASPPGGRAKPLPGTLKLIFLDPAR